MSIIFDKNRPTPTPNRVEAVNYDTLFPDMSPMLFLLENLTLMDALEAAESRKHIFLPTLANDARSKKYMGNYSVIISMYIEMFKAIIAMNLHFFTSSSKFLPYLLANKIPPS